MAFSGAVSLVLGCAGTVLLVNSADAHHSFALFDNQKSETISGTIKDFQWTNPHCWIQVLVKDPATGDVKEWSIETDSVIALSRRGWTRHSLSVGADAVLSIHPLKSGETGGSLISATSNGVEMLAGPSGRPNS